MTRFRALLLALAICAVPAMLVAEPSPEPSSLVLAADVGPPTIDHFDLSTYVDINDREVISISVPLKQTAAMPAIEVRVLREAWRGRQRTLPAPNRLYLEPLFTGTRATRFPLRV